MVKNANYLGLGDLHALSFKFDQRGVPPFRLKLGAIRTLIADQDSSVLMSRPSLNSLPLILTPPPEINLIPNKIPSKPKKLTGKSRS